LLLLEAGAIAQRPFVEVTPSYAVETGFSTLKIPQPISDLLTELGGFRPLIGVYPPYKHQADALEAFFGKTADDLIVATGTGSGKTETFLYSAIGSLAMEATERQASFAMPGVRVLLLYPMNALVSDQTSRLRRMFGDERMAGLFEKRWGRRPRFPSVHACLNEVCPERRFTEEAKSILGRFYTEPRTHCKCGARVFEIFTHRDCGAAFMRAFGVGRRADSHARWSATLYVKRSLLL
jgi:hypothetical protein